MTDQSSDEPITDSVFMPGDRDLTWFQYESAARANGQEPSQKAFMDLRDGYWVNPKVANMLRKMWTE